MTAVRAYHNLGERRQKCCSTVSYWWEWWVPATSEGTVKCQSLENKMEGGILQCCMGHWLFRGYRNLLG